MAQFCRRMNKPLLIGAILSALITFLVFFTARNHELLELDDLGYIIDNRHIDALNWDTVVWSFTRFHEANWHPLTMLSLALDRQLWGLNPFGFHLTNIVLHCGTVFCCCLLFAAVLERAWFHHGSLPSADQNVGGEATIAVGSSAGALFFGLHPLRVESVVWASERKDTLCLFFLTAAFLSYFRFVSQQEQALPTGSRPFRAYLLVLLLAGLALLSKPTAVSFPLLLLVIDWYPLARISDGSSFKRAVREKVPLFLLAAGTAGLTMLAQQEPLSLSSTLTLSSKLLVAGKALLWYLWQTLWPRGLAPLYPHPGNVAEYALGEYLVYGGVVLAICCAAVLLARRHRKMWPALGLFYLASLLPMLGIVHVGRQWVADRYSYLPALALSLLWGGGVAWLLARLKASGQRQWVLLAGAMVGCPLLAYAVVTLQYIPQWRTTETIATREIDLFPRQLGAPYHARANYLNAHGAYERALVDIDTALALALRKVRRDKYLAVAITRAKILRNLDRPVEALAAIDWGIQAGGEKPSDEAVALRNDLADQVADKGLQSNPLQPK